MKTVSRMYTIERNRACSKLGVAYQSGGTTSITEYAGNKVYKNGTLSMILTNTETIGYDNLNRP